MTMLQRQAGRPGEEDRSKSDLGRRAPRDAFVPRPSADSGCVFVQPWQLELSGQEEIEHMRHALWEPQPFDLL